MRAGLGVRANLSRTCGHTLGFSLLQCFLGDQEACNLSDLTSFICDAMTDVWRFKGGL